MALPAEASELEQKTEEWKLEQDREVAGWRGVGYGSGVGVGSGACKSTMIGSGVKRVRGQGYGVGVTG